MATLREKINISLAATARTAVRENVNATDHAKRKNISAAVVANPSRFAPHAYWACLGAALDDDSSQGAVDAVIVDVMADLVSAGFGD